MLTDLENWLIVEDTLPDIADYLLTGLTSWFEDPFETEPVIISTIPYIRQAACLQSQEILGWYAFLCGFIVEPLVTCQQTYYSSIHLDGAENDGQYALFIGAGKSYTSSGCTGMQRSVNPKRITTTAGVRQIFQV